MGKSKNNLGNVVASGISLLTGEAHFIVQSTADSIAHTEGYLVSKLTGTSKSNVIKRRQIITKRSQQDLANIGSAMGTAFKNRYTSRNKSNK
jgi:hypothetical protein